MILNNEFIVEAPAGQVWDLLMDFERMASCMPGATYRGRDGEDINGSVKIKVGPIIANFDGTARFLDQDPRARTAVVTASGKDPRGQASATATITARLEPQGDERTRVVVDTDLTITGRIAQFGRGAIADVATRIISQFTENLHREVLAGAITSETATTGAGSTSARSTDASSTDAEAAQVGATGPAASPGVSSTGAPSRASEPADLDLLAVAAPILLRRIGVPLVSALLGGVAGWLVGRRRTQRRDGRCCSMAD